MCVCLQERQDAALAAHAAWEAGNQQAQALQQAAVAMQQRASELMQVGWWWPGPVWLQVCACAQEGGG